ncbi:MAG: hypothetical protein WD512_05460, partial [Candidatus Paceibacterota bacterium]
MALEIEYYNDENLSKVGAIRVFSDPDNRIAAYGSVKKQLSYSVDFLIDEYNKTLENDPKNIATQEQLKNNIDLLSRAVENFGDPKKVAQNKEQNTVLAFQMKKSRFKTIQEELVEDPTDLENTRVLQDYKGNVINPKNLAAPSTLLIISKIFKVEKNEDGSISEVLDTFGIPELEAIDVIWNKLSRVLEGSFDYPEMYQRLVENSENTPEFIQVLDTLRNPNDLEITDKLQFAIETNFFKDFKKPRVKFLQYNINKTIVEREQFDEEGRKTKDEKAAYESVVTKSNFDTSSVISDWKANFTTASLEINPYIELNIDGNPRLNTEKILRTFTKQNGTFDYQKSREFLEVFGIYMDRSSSEINRILKNPLEVGQAFKLDLVL